MEDNGKRLRLKLELLFVTGQQVHVQVAVPAATVGQTWGVGPYATTDELRRALLIQVRERNRLVLPSLPDEAERSAGFLCGDLLVNTDHLLQAVITPT